MNGTITVDVSKLQHYQGALQIDWGMYKPINFVNENEKVGVNFYRWFCN